MGAYELNQMSSLKRYIVMAGIICSATHTTVYAQDSFPEVSFTGYADARLSYSSGETSWFDRGFGKTRYGTDPSGNDEFRLNLAEAALLTEIKFNWDFSGFVNVKFDPEQKHSVDIVEAFLKYNKLMDSGYRVEARLGTFYPHVSLENYDIAWTSPYSITPSAINSWIGEEIKTTGLELFAEKEFDNFALSVNGSVFGLNDTAGALLFFRGWSLHDNKTTLFGEYNLPASNAISPAGMFNQQAPYTSPHYELDGRPGFSVGADFELYGFFTLNTYYYDNRGDPEALVSGQYGWETDFINIGLTIDYFQSIEVFGQYMKGNTKMGPYVQGLRASDADYESAYLMLSKQIDMHRISARFDYFRMIDNSLVEINNNNETGHAWMIAYAADLFEGQRLIVELLHINSTRPERVDFAIPTKSKETQLQLSYRVTF